MASTTARRKGWLRLIVWARMVEAIGQEATWEAFEGDMMATGWDRIPSLYVGRGW